MSRSGSMEPHAKHLRSDSMVHLLTERQLKTTDQPEASAHLSSISARSEDGIVLLDRNLRCQAWNSFIENLSFVWVRQLAGTPCLETSSLLKELGIEDELIMALQGNTITCPDTPYAVKTGEAVWLAPVCSPLRNAEGQICGVMVLLRNVTENKRLSETLLRGEVGPREARAQVKKGGWQWDIKTDAITWSDELYRIAGRQPKTAVPAFREHSCFYTSDSWWRLTTATLRVLQTGLPYQIELQL